MDVIYQFKEFDRFYPAEAAMMALLLAVLPYFIFRSIVENVARWWLARNSQLLSDEDFAMTDQTVTAKSDTDRISVELSSRRAGTRSSARA